VDEIVPCIGDQEACLNEFLEGGHPQCSVNPRSAFEDVLPADLPPAPKARRVGVVGAGPAGLQAALTAARRGHRVTLYEQRAEIGGMLVPGSQPKIKYEVGNYLAFLRGAVERACRENGLDVRLGEAVTPAGLKAAGFDALVICTGGSAVRPKLPGLDGPNVVQAVDVFRDPSIVGSGQRVVVIGGGAVGCEAAHFLASEHGKQVKVVEMLPAFMVGQCTANRGHLIHELERLGVELWNCTKLKSVQLNSVTLLRNVSKSVPNPYNTWTPLVPENIPNPLARPIREEVEEQVVPADCVVLAMGLRPNTALYDACLQANAAPEIRQIGDAFEIGRVFEAVKAGYAVGRTI
jgi:2-enoate reductase